MIWTEFYFMIQTYGFFIMLGILGLMIVACGIWWLVFKIKKLKRRKNTEKTLDKVK